MNYNSVKLDQTQELVGAGEPFEVVFVSSDKSAEELMAYMKVIIGHGPKVRVYREKFNIGFFGQTFEGSSYTCKENRKKFWAKMSMLNFSWWLSGGPLGRIFT